MVSRDFPPCDWDDDQSTGPTCCRMLQFILIMKKRPAVVLSEITIVLSCLVLSCLVLSCLVVVDGVGVGVVVVVVVVTMVC